MTDDEETKDALVVVPDDQLSLAIGREGQNVRLAHRLTGWKIDIKSISQMEDEEASRDSNYDYSEEEVEIRINPAISSVPSHKSTVRQGVNIISKEQEIEVVIMIFLNLTTFKILRIIAIIAKKIIM